MLSIVGFTSQRKLQGNFPPNLVAGATVSSLESASHPYHFQTKTNTTTATTITTTTTTTATMATGNLLGPQPDMGIIATEVLKVANIPAFADGQQILAELRAIREQSTRDSIAIREQSTRDNAAIHQDIAALRQDLMTTITASYV